MRNAYLCGFLVLLGACHQDSASGPPSWRVGGGQQSLAPWGLAIDADDHVYVSELFGNKIDKFTQTGTLLTRWGAAGTGDGQFDWPKYLDVDADGNIYVADNLNHRVQKFDAQGAFIKAWGGYCEASEDCDGKFNGPTGLAVDRRAGVVFVVDSNNSRVERFDTSGAFLGAWGSHGTGEGQFRFVDLAAGAQGAEGDLAVDGQGAVYVVDNWNHRVQKFTGEGAFITAWGTEGTGEGQFAFPSPVAIDADGVVYVADNSGNYNQGGNIARIQRFDGTGAFLDQWILAARDRDQVNVGGLAIDSAGTVFVIQDEEVAMYAPPFPWLP